jgi:MFS family permease
MGIATFLIGLLPTYPAIGWSAPALLVVLRLAQGFALGGEWSWAVLVATENAPQGKRARSSGRSRSSAPRSASSLATAFS